MPPGAKAGQPAEVLPHMSATDAGDPPPTRFDAVVEAAIGALVIALLAWTGLSGWRFYTTYVLPEARVVPTATATPVKDPEEIRQEARRFRLASDHVGAGIAFRRANRPDLAQQEFLAALAVDPANVEARQNLAEMGIAPPPAAVASTPPTPAPTMTPIPSATPRR